MLRNVSASDLGVICWTVVTGDPSFGRDSCPTSNPTTPANDASRNVLREHTDSRDVGMQAALKQIRFLLKDLMSTGSPVRYLLAAFRVVSHV